MLQWLLRSRESCWPDLTRKLRTENLLAYGHGSIDLVEHLEALPFAGSSLLGGGIATTNPLSGDTTENPLPDKGYYYDE